MLISERIFKDEESITPDAVEYDKRHAAEREFLLSEGTIPIPPSVLSYTTYVSRFYGSVI